MLDPCCEQAILEEEEPVQVWGCPVEGQGGQQRGLELAAGSECSSAPWWEFWFLVPLPTAGAGKELGDSCRRS